MKSSQKSQTNSMKTLYKRTVVPLSHGVLGSAILLIILTVVKFYWGKDFDQKENLILFLMGFFGALVFLFSFFDFLEINITPSELLITSGLFRLCRTIHKVHIVNVAADIQFSSDGDGESFDSPFWNDKIASFTEPSQKSRIGVTRQCRILIKMKDETYRTPLLPFSKVKAVAKEIREWRESFTNP